MAKANPLKIGGDEPQITHSEISMTSSAPEVTPEVTPEVPKEPTVAELMKVIADMQDQLQAAQAGRLPVHDSNALIHDVPSVLKGRRVLTGGTVREDF